ncbi:PAS domain-containing sensor histidine kinase [Candidatus Daviesbacteria bacterium]|nr:PAS domain-containing sensor histidine kinase [Candidatus Daviesbacteria bacterium]
MAATLKITTFVKPVHNPGQSFFQFQRLKLSSLVSVALNDHPLRRIPSPLLTLVGLAAIELLKITQVFVFDQLLLLQLLVVYVAFSRGLGAGLNSAAMVWLYSAYYYSQPYKIFFYSLDNLVHLAQATVSLPLSAVLVGILKYRSDLRIKEHIERVKEQEVAKVMAKSEKQYRLLFDKNPQPMWIFDSHSLRFLAINTAAIRHYGFSREEFLSMTVKDIRPPEDWPHFLKYTKEGSKVRTETGFSQKVEWRHRKKDGTLVDVEVKWSPISFQGKDARLVLVNDITARKRLDKLKEDFMSIASHELKTPITVLKLLVENQLQHYYKRKEVKLAELAMVDSELERLTRLIDDMLNISRIELGKFLMRLEIIDLIDLIAEVVKQMQVIARSHKIVFQEKRKVIIEADPDRLRQVFINLISNAIKHSPAKSKILITLKRQTNNVLAKVQDYGEGIPKEKQPFLFDRFYQTKESQGNGFGLGLYIAKEIIDRHRGKIWVESQVNKGSTFYLTIPIRRKH